MVSKSWSPEPNQYLQFQRNEAVSVPKKECTSLESASLESDTEVIVSSGQIYHLSIFNLSTECSILIILINIVLAVLPS